MWHNRWLALAAILLIGGVVLAIRLWLRTPNPLPEATETETFPVVSYETRSDSAVRITNSTTASLKSDQNPCVIDGGTAIVFTRFANGYNRGPSALVRVELATGKETVVINDGEHDHVNAPGSCWDRAKNRIVFSSDRTGGADEIFSIRTDGTELKQLTTHSEPAGFVEPALSPDGLQLAFEHVTPTVADGEHVGRVVVANADGTSVKPVLGDSTMNDRLPSWSIDGQLLFQRQVRSGEEWAPWDIWVAQRSGSEWSAPINLTSLIAPESDETDNSWFPDSRWIVSSSNYGTLAHPQLFAFLSDGGVPIQITNDPTREDGAASVDPTGRWVVFESHRTADEESPTDLWLIELPSKLRQQ